MIAKEVIKGNFSKCARFYDQYAYIQNLCAAELIAAIKTDGLKEILDIGCGTGNYTRLLKAKFPFAKIKAVDISAEMISLSKKKLPTANIEFLIADAETINFKERFDLISSNATFQWFQDLAKTLGRYQKLLRNCGFILFSSFGPGTFCELNECLNELFLRELSLSSTDFLDRQSIERAMKTFFKKVKVREEIYKKEYNSLIDLLKSIKYTGSKGVNLIKNRIWTPGTLAQGERIYRKKFKKILASYQIFFCRGAK